MIINANAHNPLGIQMDLVFENPFDEALSDKFEIDLRGCRFICISFMVDYVDRLICTAVMPIDFSGPTSNMITYYKNKYVYYRSYAIEQDGITFRGSGWSNASSGETMTNSQSYMIPYRIYTIR